MENKSYLRLTCCYGMSGQICLVFTEPENINYSINTMCRLWWVLTVKNNYKNITQTPVGARGNNILHIKVL